MSTRNKDFAEGEAAANLEQRLLKLEQANIELAEELAALKDLRNKGVGAMWAVSMIVGLIVAISSEKFRDTFTHFFGITTIPKS